MRAFSPLLLMVPAVVSAAGTPRASITFILGADEDTSLPMYRMAEAYFQTDPTERTDQVILGLRSLREVRNHLVRHPPMNGSPWGLVNLVIHANSRGHLEAAIEPGGPPASPTSLNAALREGAFPPAPDAVLDEASEIRIQGCAAGKDEAFLRMVSEAFGGQDPRRPLVRATTYYTCFQDGPSGPRRFLCEAWDLVHPPAAKPGTASLEAWWKGQAHPPDLPIEAALSTHAAQGPGSAFSYESEARFSWTLVYAQGDGPVASPSPAGLRAWLLPQEAFQRSLQKNHLDASQFDWTASKERLDWRGEICTAIRVVGEGRALHILRRLPLSEGCPRPELAWDDARYYASVR